MENPAVLSVLINDRRTGIILETDETLSHCIPIYDGKTLQRARRLKLAGHDFTEYLSRVLDRGIEFEIVNHMEMKEKLRQLTFFM